MLAPERRDLCANLPPMKYVVVDIETTGGKPSGNAITEIGVVHVEHGRAVFQWSSLVRPDRAIPHNIQVLTGITNEMVENAPTFEALVPELEQVLDGDIFVAHSVNFDYSFIEAAFKSVGRSWRMDKLCTVKYARAMFPELGRYSLAHLSRELGVENDQPHRALSDALCAAGVLVECLTADYDQKTLNDPNKGLLRRIQLPDHLPLEQFTSLPETTGVYQFLDAFHQPLYIGKAKNIKKRITQHFSTEQGSTKFQRLMKECHYIFQEEFPNETLSLVYEDHLIRKHWPPLNKAQKAQTLKFGVYAFTNGRGELQWAVKPSAGPGALRRFGSYVSAQQWLANFKREASAQGFSDKEALAWIERQNEQRILLAFPSGAGALLLERGAIVGIYKGDDYLHNLDWIRANFIAVQPSPTTNAMAKKMVEQLPDHCIDLT